MKKLWHKITMWILFSLVLLLLIFHLFNLDFVVVDNITLLLIVLLVMILFIPYIKKIKWGDLEAEINSEEVTKIEKEVKKLPEIKKEEMPYDKAGQISEEINLVLESDHILALAKLRIELEKILNQMLSKLKDTPRKMGISQIVRVLEKEGLLNKSHISPIREVIYLCNRAVHGEDVKEKDANLIVEIGLNLLSRLYYDHRRLVMKPVNKSTIQAKERDTYFNAKYEVITIIPLVEKPRKNKYIFTQEELDNFLENYLEYAEFLVSIKKIK